MNLDEGAVSEECNNRSADPLHHPLDALVDGAQRVAVQPLQYAASLGRSMGDFVLGEMGHASDGVSHDSTQIQHTAHSTIPQHATAQRDSMPPQESTMSAVSNAQVDTSPFEVTGGNAEKDSLPLHKSSTPFLSYLAGSSSKMEAFPQERGQDQPEHTNSSVYGSKHYNPKNDVLLRLETMTSYEVRILNLVLWLWLFLAFGVLAWQFIEKFHNPFSAVSSFAFIDVNLTIGSLCFIAVSAALITHCVRIGFNWRKDWVRRRLQSCAFVTVELFAQWINLTFFIIPNALYRQISYKPGCLQLNVHYLTWFAFVRWSMWNTMFAVAVIQAHNSNISTAAMIKRVGDHRIRRSGQMKVAVADMPFWTAHWWKLVLWCLTEGSIVGMALYVVKRSNYPLKTTCGLGGGRFRCDVGGGALGITSIMLALTVAYFLLYCFFLLRAITQLRGQSTVEFKLANTIVRIQLRLRFPAFAFFILSLLLLWYVKPFSCNSIVNTWMGMLPGQMSASVLVICTSFVATPKLLRRKGRLPLLQVWLQEFAWSEKEKPQKVEVRDGSMAPEDRELIQKEPMFCVETMLTCLYWSLLIYDHKETVACQTSIEEACNMFQPALDHYEMFWEKSLDTKCLLAWNRQNIVLSFRGTASLSNVKADVQAWRTTHQPLRGSFFRRPKVHSGFYKAWRNNWLDQRIIEKIKELLSDASVDLETCRLTITGHSLGGALATLAAYDICAISKAYGFHGRVSCITFGAPRTGNHHFVKDFNTMVGDCWNVINDQDLVARGGKFFFFYKRGGHRVIINRMGDLIVRPSPIEASLRLIPCSGSVQQHLLTSYLQSVRAILVTQFKASGSKTDMLAILELIRHNSAFQTLLLEEVALTVKDLEDAYTQGGSRDLMIKHKQSLKKSGKSLTAHESGIDGRPSTTRGMIKCSCCASFSLWVRDVKTDSGAEVDSDLSDSEVDVNVRDGEPALQPVGVNR